MLHPDVREAIYYLRQQRLNPPDILAQINAQFPDEQVSIRSVYRWMDQPPAPRPVPPARYALPDSQPRGYLSSSYSPAAPVQPEPDEYFNQSNVIDAEYWEVPRQRKQLPPASRNGYQRRTYRHPDTGQFISREEWEDITRGSQAVVRHEAQRRGPRSRADLVDDGQDFMLQRIGELFIGRAPDEADQASTDPDAGAVDYNSNGWPASYDPYTYCGVCHQPQGKCICHVLYPTGNPYQQRQAIERQTKRETIEQHNKRAHRIGGMVFIGGIVVVIVIVWILGSLNGDDY